MSKKSRGRKNDVRRSTSANGSVRSSLGRTQRAPQRVAPSNTRELPKPRAATLRDSVAQALREGGKPNTAWRDVNRVLSQSQPLPAQHVRKSVRGVGVLSPRPKAKTQAPKTKLANPENLKSPQAREQKKSVCKERPHGHNPRRAGGGASKDWVPWCEVTRRR